MKKSFIFSDYEVALVQHIGRSVRKVMKRSSLLVVGSRVVI